jgi:hypothetical protein
MGRLGLGLGIGAPARRKLAGEAYDAGALAYFAAMTTPPGSGRKALLNALIVGLKADGVWARLDWLSLFAAHDAQAARLNAVNPAQAFTVVSSPAFTIDRGYQGAASSYLQSGWAPAAHAVNYARDSAFTAAWSRTNATNSTVALGNTATYTSPKASDGMRAQVNSAGANEVAAVADSIGLHAADRRGASLGSLYKNGVEIGADAIDNASTALSGEQFYALGRNVSNALAAGDTVRQYAAMAWGGHLTAAEHLALYTRLDTYLTAVGAA